MEKIKFEIVGAIISDLTPKQFGILRRMTLKSLDSMMRKALWDGLTNQNIKIAIAKNNGKYLGWALVNKYWNNKEFLMVFVKPEYRRQGIGAALAKHFRKRGVMFCYRWDSLSTKFYNSVNLINVYR